MHIKKNKIDVGIRMWVVFLNIYIFIKTTDKEMCHVFHGYTLHGDIFMAATKMLPLLVWEYGANCPILQVR